MILIHIGLPKTATTSLQFDYFTALGNLKDCVYIGLKQPRHWRRQTTAYRSIIDFSLGKASLRDARIALDPIYSSNKLVIFSDEMLMVSSHNVSWVEKLSRTAILAKNYDYKILLTTRDAVDASISYYIERFSSFSPKSYLECFQSEHDFQIYNYSYLMNTLDSLFPTSNIEFIDFNELVKNPRQALYPVHKLLPHSSKDDSPLLTKHRNKKTTLRERLCEKPQMLSFFPSQSKLSQCLIRACLLTPIISYLFVLILNYFFPKSLRVATKSDIPEKDILVAREIDKLRCANSKHLELWTTLADCHHD